MINFIRDNEQGMRNDDDDIVMDYRKAIFDLATLKDGGETTGGDTGGECPYWNWEEDYCEWRKEKVECSYCGASSLIERQHEKNEKNTEWDWPLIMFGGIGLFMLLWLLGVI